MLKVGGLHSYYGQAHILADVALEVNAGEVVVLLGRNGAGKSTTTSPAFTSSATSARMCA